MKISIDTKEDSVEDIKRLINMLQNFVEHRQVSSESKFADIFGNSQSNDSGNGNNGGLFSMFGSNNDNNETDQTREIDEDNKPKQNIRVIEY